MASAVPALEPEILIGHPSIEIAREAERRGASLIIIGRRPVEAAGTAMLGPTADQIVRGASVPCLVLSPGPWRPTPRILAAVDGTERGERVLAGATAIAHLLRGTVRSVTVVAAPRLSPSGRTGPDGPRVVRSGDPVDEVLAEARVGVDLLAVGVHRLGRPDSDLERGIARRIIRQARGPVLTIPL
jgi:nucleotide-binding universal stress UspA family protein